MGGLGCPLRGVTDQARTGQAQAGQAIAAAGGRLVSVGRRRPGQNLSDGSVLRCRAFSAQAADAFPPLKNLFEALFARGVTLVATSNIVPERLYENGLQRERFLPAIALVQKHCRVLNVDSGIDYRLRVLTHVELYHTPLDVQAETSLRRSFGELAHGAHVYESALEINDREVLVKARTDDVLWCEFDELCEKPRSAQDYIELAREYHTVLISNVPQLGELRDNAARRFINLIDEFYDRQVKVILSAEVPIAEIYTKGRLNFEIRRTQSRLQEMQSLEYLQLPHLP